MTKRTNRRRFLAATAAAAAATAACRGDRPVQGPRTAPAEPPTPQGVAPSYGRVAQRPQTESPDVRTEPLTFPWTTEDPFLFCAYHLDAYPSGDSRMGPGKQAMQGRRIGSDFSRKDGWSMYHGDVVPGFPKHPHRGFETVTVTRSGFVDHSDSLGATARYGKGDAQWMTAGRGIVHSEMFPLRQTDADNPLELFQVWLNLPAKNKMVEPYFSMLWSEHIPKHRIADEAGRVTTVTTIAGALGGQKPPAPPPDSWASDPRASVAIWTIDMQAGASWVLPASSAGLSRTLYFFRGGSLEVAGQRVSANTKIRALQSDRDLLLRSGDQPAELLLLEGRPIGEPVAHHGPFVMNTRQQLREAFMDYQRSGFGRWTWGSDGPVHGREEGRFAIHVDGRRDVPG